MHYPLIHFLFYSALSFRFSNSNLRPLTSRKGIHQRAGFAYLLSRTHSDQKTSCTAAPTNTNLSVVPIQLSRYKLSEPKGEDIELLQRQRSIDWTVGVSTSHCPTMAIEIPLFLVSGGTIFCNIIAFPTRKG